MFGWEFAKSAEAMFSRWAIKRICKFVLKKKLGDYLLGDIDLDQLDVQLRQGTIQLNDLALNADFINLQLGGSPVIVKEGSIASLSIKIPWKMKNCQIEVEELELVLAPCGTSNLTTSGDAPSTSEDGTHCSEKPEQGTGHTTSGSVSLNVHEGVKTIAKIVKLFLTSFHVRLKNLIIAFDPGSKVDEKGTQPIRTLVLRIAETEYGTCVSEAVAIEPNSKPESLLGSAKLTNFIKFQGAAIEFLEMDNIDSQPQTSCSFGRSLTDFSLEGTPSGYTTKILGGASGGFSGILNLAIPWKNGCLDIKKLDADISIDPVELILQPSTITWIFSTWGSLKDGTKDSANIHRKAKDSVIVKYRSRGPIGSSVSDKEIPMPSGVSSFYSPYGQETMSNALLPGAHLIHNWVPLSIDLDDQLEADPDYGASIDQFFECFDGMRSSQASLGRSGIWNWTCSVFSAITAASSLASGCGHIPSEQQNVETNLKAAIAAFSIVLSFHDEEKYTCHMIGDYQHTYDMQRTTYKSFSSDNMVDPLPNDPSSESYLSSLPFIDTDLSVEDDSNRTDVNFLNATCLDLSLVLQISPQCTMFEASVRHIKVDHHFRGGNRGFINASKIHHLQAGVQVALPPFPFSTPESEEKINGSGNVNLHPIMQSVNDNSRESTYKTISHDEPVKIALFESFGECSGEYTIRSNNSSDKSMTLSSFSVNLPPFLLWIDFHLVNSLMNLFKQYEDYVENSTTRTDYGSDITDVHDDFTSKDVKNGNYTQMSTVPSRGNLQGHIIIPNARIILCFASENNQEFPQLFSWNKFISLEFSCPTSSLGKVPDGIPAPTANFQRSHSYTASTSISLESGNLNLYLVTAANENVSGTISQLVNRSLFSANRILSATSGTEHHHSMITMLWQKGPVTGPWMARRAWNLAASQDPKNRNRATGKGDEFTSVTAAEDLVEANCHVRQEMVLSSAFFIHIHFALLCGNLAHHEYALLCLLLNQMIDVSCEGSDNDLVTHKSVKNDKFALGYSNSQASIILECDILDLCITTDKFEEISVSMQKELPGFWDSIRLKVEKFELLSVSDIGGVGGANYFWLSHGEGELWGSIIDLNSRASAATRDFLLITCRNSSLRRGDGEGGNAISYGPAGTCITHLKNPETLQGFTSIIVRCGTIVAPGCRLDWFNTIRLFFVLPSRDFGAVEDQMQNRNSEGNVDYKTSFFLDLVDVSLSYEPQNMSITAPDSDYSSCDQNKASGQQYVACLLAVASLSLSNQTAENLISDDLTIRLQDIGFLICQWPGHRSGRRYDVDYLREAGYVKIAGDALVVCVVRTSCQDGLLWEVEFSDSLVKLDTCSDTTLGLVRLLAQLQQIFTPNVEDALVHLQSRANQENDVINKSKTYDNPEAHDQTKHSAGLMDEILDDFFYLQGEQISQPDSGTVQSGISVNEAMSRDGFNLNRNHLNVDDVSSQNISSRGSIPSGNLQPVWVDTTSSPELIESYYISELFPKSQLSSGDPSSNEVLRCEGNASVHSDVEGGRGGWYKNSSLMIDENHISNMSSGCAEQQVHQEDVFFSVHSFSTDLCNVRGRVLLKNTDVRWRMFGGSDWLEARKSSSDGSISRGRDENVYLEVQLRGLSLQHDMYPDGEIFVSKLSLSIQDFHIYDNSRDAPWKMVLGYYHAKHRTRESCAKAFKLDLESVRPDPLVPLEEYRLHLAFLPMRLHLDQSQLNFLINFFGGNSSARESSDHLNDLGGQGMGGAWKERFGQENVVEETLLPFFQKCDIWPLVVRVDYVPRRIDLAALRGGKYIELINLVPWKGIDLQLKHVHSVGVYGWGGICEAIVGEWLEDISQNQVHKVLKGLKPVQSLFSVSSGAAKLVSLPIKDYRKDHRLIKGIQRGAITFLRSISLEAVGLGVHLAAGAHDILFQTECALASIPPSIPLSGRSRAKASVRSNQPKDARQGIQQAYESLSDGLGRTASALVGTPIKTYQRGAGAGFALANAIRAAPGAAVAPASAAARAVHCALLGVRNSLDPEHKKESMEKYLGSSQSQDRLI